MENSLMETVGMLGIDVILIATLVLFALHAIDTWRSRRSESDTREKTVHAVDCQVHDFTRVQHAKVAGQEGQPTRRAA